MIEILLMFLIGISVKLADQFSDFKRPEIYTGIVFGIIYGLLLGYVIATNSIIATFSIGIIIAVALTKKFDSISHLIGIMTALLTVIFIGNLEANIVLIGIFLLSGFADEKLNDKLVLKTKNRFKEIIRFVAKYRLASEITALTIAITLAEPLYWLGLLSFDIGYLVTEKVYEKIMG